MRIGMIGLGRMGMNMARRLLRGGIEVVAFNRTPAKTDKLAGEDRAVAAYSLEEMLEQLTPPRMLWLMLPAGDIVAQHLDRLLAMLSPGDIIIDGGNSYYKDALVRAEKAKSAGVSFLDAGTSGGIWGLEVGYCLMVGGEREAFEHVEPILKVLAPENGYLHCGPHGAGHFVKMIHNGVEYGMMQAYAEGFALMQASPYGKTLDFSEVSKLWNQGSVVRSWLLELAEAAFFKSPRLEDIRGYVEDSGEGRWTVMESVESGVSAPVITLSLMERFRSRNEDSFADRVLAALRNEFGGHAVKRAE